MLDRKTKSCVGAALGAACLLAAWQSSWAAGPGTTGANFLRIPVGPRQVGMGDQGVALADDAFSLNHNPASMALLHYQEFAFMHNQWAEGVTQEYAAYVYPKLSLGSLGASLNLLQVGSFQGYDNSGAKTEDVSAQDMAVSLGYARRVWGPSDPEEGLGLSAGLSVKYLKERLENDSASTYAGDAGLLCHFPAKGVSMKIGAAAQQLGSGLKYYGNKSRLPQTYAFGVSGTTRRVWGDPLTLSVEARKSVDNQLSFSVGGEYWINALFALRVGYRSQDDLGPGIRAGMGLKIKLLQFDYGMSLMGAFGVSHRAGFTYRFGAPVERTPEPSPQQKMADKAVRQAKHLVAEKRYLEALLEINRALDLDPRSPEALQLLDQVQKIMREMEKGPAP